MKPLQVTNYFGQGKRRHRHVVFVNENDGTGQCSFNDDHVHEVIFVPPPPSPQVGPDGQPLPMPPYQPPLDMFGQPLSPGFHLQPSLDGHSHLLEDYVLVAPKKAKEDPREIVEEVRYLWKTACDIESDSLKKFEESERFYKGDHWDTGERQRLNDLSRAAVSINMIEKNVDQICGTQRQERSDIRFIPVEGGDQRVADMGPSFLLLVI